MIRLAIVVTHPIQYYSPVFKLLTEREKIQIKVFYTWAKAGHPRYDPGFSRVIQWDIPLLEGYEYAFVKRGVLYANSLNRDIEDWHPDALLVIGWNFPGHLKAMLHFKKKIPVLFRGDSTLLDAMPGLRRLIRGICLSWVYRYIDLALYVGRNNKEYFLKYGLKENQLCFSPHAVDNLRFQEAGDENKEKALLWRRSLGINDDETVFLFAGKLEPKKNPFLPLEAFKQINDQKAHLVFVGNGICEGGLKKQASLPRVHFINFQNQSVMPVVYRLGDIFVLPSQKNETWGLAVNEAMSCGLAVLVSDKCGCAADLVRNGENGYIFSANNRKDLVIRMRAMLQKDRLKDAKDASVKLIQAWSLDALCGGIEEGVCSLNRQAKC